MTPAAWCKIIKNIGHKLGWCLEYVSLFLVIERLWCFVVNFFKVIVKFGARGSYGG